MLYGVNCSCFSRCVVLGGTFGDGKAIEQFRLFYFKFIMNKTLFTLTLLLVSLFSFADADSYLKEHIEIYPVADRCTSYVAVPTANKEKIVMSPCIIQIDENSKIATVSAINENGLVQIAKLNNISRLDDITLLYSTRFGYWALRAIYLPEKLDELKSEGVQIDIDFDYLFLVREGNYPSYKDNYNLVNERGELVYYIENCNYNLCYCEELFYLIGTKSDSNSAGTKYKWNILSLAKILTDYATGIKQTSAKAELQSSKTYDITGVEVDTETKGITIQDGKKIMK